MGSSIQVFNADDSIILSTSSTLVALRQVSLDSSDTNLLSVTGSRSRSSSAYQDLHGLWILSPLGRQKCNYLTEMVSRFHIGPYVGPPHHAGSGQYEGQRANMRANMKLTMYYYIQIVKKLTSSEQHPNFSCICTLPRPVHLSNHSVNSDLLMVYPYIA